MIPNAGQSNFNPMNAINRFHLLLILSLLATSVHRSNAANAQVHFPAGLAAVVNGRPIFDSKIRERMSPTVETLRRQYTNNPAMLEQKLKEQQLDALERLIEDELILNEATEAGREVTEKHLDLYIQNQIQTRYYDSNVFLKTLAANGTTVEAFRERHRRDDLIVAARQEQVAAIPPPTPEQIEQYYRAHEKEFWVDESVKLSLIVINKNATNGPAAVEFQRKLAAEIHARAADGGDFANLAQLYSQGSQARQGGDWGWVERRVLRKELGDAAFSLKPGGLSDVIETEEACFIMRVADRRPGALKSMAEVRDDITKTLQAQQRSAAIKQWLAKLRAEAFVQYLGGGVGTARSQAQVVAIEITHIAVSTISDAAIQSHLGVKEGELVTQASVDHDIRSLYATGHFYNIRVAAKTETGGIKLIYAVQEKPVLNDIQFTGNRNMNSRELLARLKSKTGERLDEWKLFNDARTIQSIYQTAGYPQATVKSVPNIDEKAGRGSVTFEITESP
jgi:parvulin-like peptidyl-prolyl isomerase